MLRKTTFFMLAAYAISGYADTPKDPRLRDEDISATVLDVNVSRRQDGLYSYIYTLTSPTENKGQVTTFLLDINCSHSFGEVVLPTPSSGRNFGGYFAPSDSITPTAVFGSSGQGLYGTTMDGFAMFGVVLAPGETLTDLELISPAEPGMRPYKLEPKMNNTADWAYPEEPDPTIPWIPDFTVTGSVAGPGCPGVTEPPESARFAGTIRKETEETNALLTYSGVERDRWHVDSKTKDFTFKIHYSDLVEPKTFKVQPGWAKRYFNPEPGTSELITLPLKEAVNKFHFNVSAIDSRKVGKPDYPGTQNIDRDEFEIRVDVK